MTRATALPVEERILQLLQYLGIDQAHFAARTPGDWTGLATTYPEVCSSFTLVGDRKSTRLNSSHIQKSRMPSSA